MSVDNSHNTQKKTIVKDVLIAFVLLIAFYLVSLIVLFVLAAICNLVAYFPVLNIISKFFLTQSGASPTFLLYGFAYFITANILDKLAGWMFGNSNSDNRAIAFRIMAGILIAFNIYNMVLNITAGGPLAANIMQIIFAVMMWKIG